MMRNLVWMILLVSAVAGLVYVATRDPDPWVIWLVAIVFFATFNRRFGLLLKFSGPRLERGRDLRVTNDAFPLVALPDLEWIRTGRGFELRAGQAIYATLQFDHAFFAVATAAGDRWTFDRKEWFSKRVVVRREVDDVIVASMALSGAREGVLERPDGGGEVTALRWSGRTWDTEDDWVVRYHNTSGFDTHQARVEINPSILKLPELPLVVVLGWYLTHSKLVAGRRAS